MLQPFEPKPDRVKIIIIEILPLRKKSTNNFNNDRIFQPKKHIIIESLDTIKT
jgi:hypothetical protein